MKLRASDVAVTLPANHEITKLLRIEDLSGTFFLVILLRYENVLTTELVMELRAYDVVVTLSVGKSQNYQKLRINYVTATSTISLLVRLTPLFLLWRGLMESWFNNNYFTYFLAV